MEQKTVYDTNDTMKMLGRQYSDTALQREQFKAIDDIVQARPFSFSKDAAMDIYMLGYIYGKRAERTRRAERGL